MAALTKHVEDLTQKSVFVGIPAKKTEREWDGSGSIPLTNAEIAAIHENGSPKRNIPARPFLGPGIRLAADRIDIRMRAAADAMMDNRPAEADRQLQAMGQEARDSAKNVIRRGLQPELAARVLHARKTRKKAPRTGEKPLYDTGQLVNSISYVIRKVRHG